MSGKITFGSEAAYAHHAILDFDSIQAAAQSRSESKYVLGDTPFRKINE
jgi:hypothetical protein